MVIFMNNPDTAISSIALARLDSMGIELPDTLEPKGNYSVINRSGNLLYLSGQGPLWEDKVVYSGCVGRDLSIKEGYAAARLTAINILGVLYIHGYDLDRLRFVKMLGFVSSVPGFYDQPQVINGATDLLCDVLGDRGRPARSAVAVPQLPFNTPVEIEVIIDIGG